MNQKLNLSLAFLLGLIIGSLFVRSSAETDLVNECRALVHRFKPTVQRIQQRSNLLPLINNNEVKK